MLIVSLRSSGVGPRYVLVHTLESEIILSETFGFPNVENKGRRKLTYIIINMRTKPRVGRINKTNNCTLGR